MQYFVYLIRSASLSAFLITPRKTSLSRGGLIPLGILVPRLEGHLSFQTCVEFGNGLKIQSHRTVVRGTGDKTWNAKRVESTNKKGKIVIFCVLEPMLSAAANRLKIPKTRHLPALATKVQRASMKGEKE
jgi:hypothetical protein